MKRPDEWAGRMTWAAAAMIYADYVMYQTSDRNPRLLPGHIDWK